MRRENASLINETRKKAKHNDKCQFWMTLLYILGFKDMSHSMYIYMTIVRLIFA